MDDFTSVRSRARRFNSDPLGMTAPHNSRAFIGGLLGGLGIGASLLGGLFGAQSAKSRGNEYAKLFGEQRDYSRGRAEETENLAGRWGADTGQLLFNDLWSGRGAMNQMRDLSNKQLNSAGSYLRGRVDTVNNSINQVGQTARQDIQDQGRQANAATQRALTGRGLGSSTMLAGARAQNQEATNRGISSLAENIAGVRGAATERTTGDVADFLQFRAQYAPQLIAQEAAFNRQGVNNLTGFQQDKTRLQTGLMTQNTGQDNQLLMNLINAAAGSKGATSGAIGNSLGGLGNLLFLGGLGAFG